MTRADLDVYDCAAAAMRILRDGGGEAAAVAAGESLGDAMSAPDTGLLALSLRTAPGDAALTHPVNVAILSCAAARAGGWKPAELRAVSVWAMLHDWKRGPAAGAGGSPEERDAALHPSAASALFDEAASIETTPIAQVRQLKARTQPASTTPSGMRRRPASVAALIIALSHLYESLTHPRSWRPAQPPHTVFLKLLGNLEREVDDEIIAAFYQGVSPYPPGVLVELSDGRFGTVMSINPEYPTQPQVLVRIDAKGNAVRPELRLDLALEPAIVVKNSLLPGQLPANDPRIRVRAAAGTWYP